MVQHWQQVDAIHRCLPPGGRVTEVGPGDGHVTWLLRGQGYDVTTCDPDSDVGADVRAGVEQLPFADESFDLSLAAQVLEHLPFERFVPRLRELARVVSRHVVVTLPAPLVGLSLLLNLPRFEPLGLSLGLPYWRPIRRGEHFWEIGRRGYPLRRIRRAFREAGLDVRQAFRSPLSLFSYVFITARTSIAGAGL
jgi:hypothetical protein